MAVNQLKYAQVLEQELAKGKGFQEAHDEAVKQGVLKPQAKSEPDLIHRTWARLKALFGGGEKKTVRTKTVESGLKTAGLSEKDIAKFQRKK